MAILVFFVKFRITVFQLVLNWSSTKLVKIKEYCKVCCVVLPYKAAVFGVLGIGFSLAVHSFRGNILQVNDINISWLCQQRSWNWNSSVVHRLPVGVIIFEPVAPILHWFLSNFSLQLRWTIGRLMFQKVSLPILLYFFSIISKMGPMEEKKSKHNFSFK